MSEFSEKFKRLDRMRDICKEFIRKYYEFHPGCSMAECRQSFIENISRGVSQGFTEDVDGIIFDQAAKQLEQLN